MKKAVKKKSPHFMVSQQGKLFHYEERQGRLEFIGSEEMKPLSVKREVMDELIEDAVDRDLPF